MIAATFAIAFHADQEKMEESFWRSEVPFCCGLDTVHADLPGFVVVAPPQA